MFGKLTMIAEAQMVKTVKFVGSLDRLRFHEIQTQVQGMNIQLGDVALVDLAAVNFMDSSGLSALIMALKDVRAAGGDVCLCSPQPQVKILLDLLVMEQVFKIFPDRDAFTEFHNSYTKMNAQNPLFVNF
jgi:anti-sigma B factor antagonist